LEPARLRQQRRRDHIRRRPITLEDMELELLQLPAARNSPVSPCVAFYESLQRPRARRDRLHRQRDRRTSQTPRRPGASTDPRSPTETTSTELMELALRERQRGLEICAPIALSACPIGRVGTTLTPYGLAGRLPNAAETAHHKPATDTGRADAECPNAEGAFTADLLDRKDKGCPGRRFVRPQMADLQVFLERSGAGVEPTNAWATCACRF
jgi:hypothetical protein